MDPSRRSEWYSFGDFVLDLGRGSLTRNGTEIPLRPRSYAVLEYLVQHHGQLIPRKQLIEAVWGHLHVTDSSLSQCLRDIRQALDDREQQLIHTVPGRGYRFEGIDNDAETGNPAEAPEPPVRQLPLLALIVTSVLAVALLAFLIIRGDITRSSDAESRAGPPEQVSIAVLPFLDLSAEKNLGYFADGLTEDLLNLLAGMDGIKVIARTSSFYYKDKLQDIPLSQIAAELGVTNVLEGSVRGDGERVRVSAQLIDIEQGFHVWSDSWDRELEDIFAIQDAIAAAVAAELNVKLVSETPKARVLDPRSYELALRGRFLYRRRYGGDLQQALGLFERAVEIDPDNATAWIGLTPLYLWQFDPPRIGDALEASARSIALDPTNPEAWSRRALALQTAADPAFEEARAKAVRLGGRNALIQVQIAGEQARLGDLDAALETLKRALSLDPLNIMSLRIASDFNIMAGRLDEASDLLARLLNLSPDDPDGLALMADLRLLQGRAEEARALIERAPSEPNDLRWGISGSRLWYEALIAPALGETGRADVALAKFIAESAPQRPLSVACVYAWRGEKDAAFHWIEQALTQYPDISVQYSWTPWLNSLEDDPRWAELMQRWRGAKLIRRI